MASKQDCEAAFGDLAAKLSQVDPHARKKVVLDRSISATITDLDTIFQGELRAGDLHDIQETDAATGQIRLKLSSDTLIALTDGSLGFGSAWAKGRLKIDASVLDLLKLKSMF